MYTKKDVIKLMMEKFALSVEADKLGEEAVLLYLEELDKQIISAEVLEKLPDPIVFQTYVYNEKSEWIIGIAYKEGTDNPLFLVCVKDGVKVYEKILSKRIDNNGRAT